MPALGRLGSPRYGFGGAVRPMSGMGIAREKFFANNDILRLQQIAGRAGIMGGMLHIVGWQKFKFGMQRVMYFVENSVVLAVEKGVQIFGQEMQKLVAAKTASTPWLGSGRIYSSIDWGIVDASRGRLVGHAWADESVAPYLRYFVRGNYPETGHGQVVPIFLKSMGGKPIFRTHAAGKKWQRHYYENAEAKTSYWGFDFVAIAFKNKATQVRALVNSAIKGTMAGTKLGQKGSNRAFIGASSGLLQVGRSAGMIRPGAGVSYKGGG
jgi:hypothetical protein